MIRVLALAPEVDGLPRLASAEELARIGDAPGVELRSLQDVTRQRVIDRLSREQFGALVIIGHGLPGYVVSGQGERIDPQWLAEQLSNFKVPLAIIATCWSSQRPDPNGPSSGFADVLPAAGIDTITMDTDVGDRAALEYDVAMLQSLASGSALRKAHEAGVAAAAAHGGGRQPRLTPRDAAGGRPATGGGRMEDDGYRYRLSNNEQLLRNMDGKMDRLAEQITDVTMAQKLLEERVSVLTRKVDHLESTVAAVHGPAPEVRREWLLGVGGLLLLILVLLILVTVRML